MRQRAADAALDHIGLDHDTKTLQYQRWMKSMGRLQQHYTVTVAVPQVIGVYISLSTSFSVTTKREWYVNPKRKPTPATFPPAVLPLPVSLIFFGSLSSLSLFSLSLTFIILILEGQLCRERKETDISSHAADTQALSANYIR